MPRYVICGGIILWLILLTTEAHCGDREDVERFIRADRAGMKTAGTDAIVKRLVGPIVRISQQHGVDPIMTVAIVSTESSYSTKAEYGGAIGLMQCMPRWYRKYGESMDTVEGQIQTGVKLLAYCVGYCSGNILNALGYYHTGESCKPTWRARRKYRIYLEAIEK